MHSTSMGIFLGVLGGLGLFGLQLFLTPANMILFSLVIALLFGLLTGWLIVRSPLSAGSRASMLPGYIVGGGLFLGMLVGALVYLNLPATQNYYSLYYQGKPANGPPLHSFLDEQYVTFCSLGSGIADIGIVVGVSQLTVARQRRRQSRQQT